MSVSNFVLKHPSNAKQKMALKLIRNQSNLPYLDREGTLKKPIDIERDRSASWAEHLKPYERMHVHHTLASVRRNANFRTFPGLIPTNSLDFVLSSTYNQANEVFPDRVDTVLQPETVGAPSWRRLRNTKDVLPGEDPRIAGLRREIEQDVNLGDTDEDMSSMRKHVDPKYYRGHPVLIGGLKARVHPSYVKLMNSSHHAPQTNAGYSRQTGDGNVFVY